MKDFPVYKGFNVKLCGSFNQRSSRLLSWNERGPWNLRMGKRTEQKVRDEAEKSAFIPLPTPHNFFFPRLVSQLFTTSRDLEK